MRSRRHETGSRRAAAPISRANKRLAKHPAAPDAPRRRPTPPRSVHAPSAAGRMADGELVLSIKNPGRPTAEDVRLALPPSATVRELKEALQQGYPGNPAPATVTVSRRAGVPGSPRRRPCRHLAAAVLPRRRRRALRRLAPALQAIYAGRVLKDDNAVLSTFIVPVRWGGGVGCCSCSHPAAARRAPPHPPAPPAPAPFPRRTRTPRCRSHCTL